MNKAKVELRDSKAARQLQDEAAERCSMPYRAPELFNVECNSTIDERTDIWVSTKYKIIITNEKKVFTFPINFLVYFYNRT